MNTKFIFSGFKRLCSLLFVILLTYRLTGQQADSPPVISLITPASADSLNNTGVVTLTAEIVSATPLQSFRIIHNSGTVVDEKGMKPEKKDDKTYVISSFVPLRKGLNSISVEAKNPAGMGFSETRIINSHLEPFITWLYPASDNENIPSGILNIQVEIKTVLPLRNLNVNVNGSESTRETPGTTPRGENTYYFEKRIQLKAGKNTVFLSADNGKGITRSVARIINFGLPPEITLTSPLSVDSINNSGLATIIAEIKSSSPLQTYKIYHNGLPVLDENNMKPEKKDSSTFILGTNLPLKKGINTVYVEAKNSLGTAVSEKRTINSHSEPFVIWLEPGSDNINATSGKINIKAEINTISPLQNLKVNVNGTFISPDEKSGIIPQNKNIYMFEKAIQLKPGKNLVYISAGNAKGAIKSAVRTINFGSAPVITLVSPSSRDSLNNSGVSLVRAEIVSYTPLQTFRIVNNEETAANETMTTPEQKDSVTYIIGINIPLKKGLNTIYVEVKNALGTGSSEKHTVISQSEPFITWILPAEVSTETTSGIVNIRAEIRSFFDIQNVKLSLNGTAIPAEKTEISRMNDGTYVFEKTLKDILSTKNTVLITASNARGTTVSESRIINYTTGSKPVVTITFTDSLNNSGIIPFSAEIVSRSKLQAIRVVQNGTVLVAESAKIPDQKDSVTYELKSLIPLRAGQNTFYVEAKNTFGTGSSAKRTVICQPEPIINWISPSAVTSADGTGTLKIKAEIITSFDLMSAGVNLNGTLLADQKDGITRAGNDKYFFEKALPLKEGENSIVLSAGNARGTGYSSKRTVSYVPGVISEIKWITPADENSDTRRSAFAVSASIKTKSEIRNTSLYLNGTEIQTGISKTIRKNSQEYAYENTLALKPGVNTVELSAITDQGTISAEKRTINYTPPVIPVLAWNNPLSAQSEVNQASIDIKMDIKSDEDLQNVIVYLNGKPLDNISMTNNVRKAGEGFVLGSNLILKPGDNSIYVAARNVAGTANSETRNIKYTVPSLPAISWGNPDASVSSSTSNTITINVNITSTSDIKDLKIYQNGSPLSSAPSISTIDRQQGVYRIEETINLDKGENRIYIVAGNLAGNTTSETRSISYEAPSAPLVTWISPSRPSTQINLNSADIKATVKSTEKLQSVFIYVNGVGSEEINQVTPVNAQGEYMIKKTISLQPGDNTIYLAVTNNTGTIRSEDRILTNPPPSKPEISWAVPEQNTTVNQDMIIVEACIKSSTVLKEAQIYVNGAQWASETIFPAPQSGDCNYRFTKSVLLKEGDNNVIINAINAAGSEMSERRTIRFQKGSEEKRLALVFGNADYKNSLALKNPVNDANLIEGTLKTLGFEVIKRLNANKTEMEQAIRQFSEELPDYNVALFYYAGHGIQVGGENYLIPVDAVLDKESDCQWEAVQVNTIVRQFEQVPENVNIIILDACRDNPFKSWSRGAPQGFKMLNTVSGTFVAYATSENSTAADGTGVNGVYTEELVRQMVIPQSISGVFNNTRKQVMLRTNSRQVPTESSKLVGDFFFKK
jgi:Caspase domain